MTKVIAKKICMVGPFAVGKTSLVKRFVESIFSDKYLTTIGVKISKKLVNLDDEQIQLMIWDIEGVDIFTELRPSFLRGAAGAFLVLDGTRLKSLEMTEKLLEVLNEHIPGVPVVGLLNKCDLSYEWKLGESELQEIRRLGIDIIPTSAKTGENVENAFQMLVKKMCVEAGQV